MHKYNNQDHAMMTAMLCAENILADAKLYDLWQVNADAEYHEQGDEVSDDKNGSALRLVPKKSHARARARFGKVNLRPNFDWRSVRRDAVKLFNLFVGQRDASRRPIVQPMECADPAATVLNSMDHDVEAGIHAALRCARGVFIRRIRHVKREMVITFRIAPVDRVHPFRRFHVALLFFRTDRIAAERHAITLQLSAVVPVGNGFQT